QLLHARQTRGDVDTRDAASVEGTHGELCTRLTDGLRCDDTNRIANRDESTRTHVPAVAVLADAMARLAGQRRTQIQRGNLAACRDVIAHILVDDGVALGDDLAGRLVHDVGRDHATGQLRQAQVAPVRLVEIGDPDALLGPAVLLVDD